MVLLPLLPTPQPPQVSVLLHLITVQLHRRSLRIPQLRRHIPLHLRIIVLLVLRLVDPWGIAILPQVRRAPTTVLLVRCTTREALTIMAQIIIHLPVHRSSLRLRAARDGLRKCYRPFIIIESKLTKLSELLLGHHTLPDHPETHQKMNKFFVVVMCS